jgi:uncharacterized protein YcaQ
MPRAITLEDLRRHAIARSLTRPGTLLRAIERLGFVQADPIRAPARAEDLILRHRVVDYRAGELQRRYPKLPVEEDCLVNYGFLPRRHLTLMHPRVPKQPWDAATESQAREVLAYIQARGTAHSRDIQAAFSHGRVQGYWGQELNASTHLLDGMHYRGWLRVIRREAGRRVYAPIQHPEAEKSAAARSHRAEQLVNLVVQLYAPLPSRSLSYLVQLLGYGAPHLRAECREALSQARSRLPQTVVSDTTWYWPEGEDPRSRRWQADDKVRFLAPFDPLVWDRNRFEMFWGWPYRLEAYTPPARRLFGHYALPVLWRDAVIGWANVSHSQGHVQASLGFVGARPREPAFEQELAAEMERLARFLSAEGGDSEP